MKLLFRQRAFSWFDSYDVYDENENTVYVVKGQLSWGHCLKIYDPEEQQELGTVKEEILTWLPKFELYEGENYIGCLEKELGWFKPKWGHSIAFLGTVFINMMFCVVVPLVFASIAGSVANMESRQRAGKIMGVTVGTFVITGAIAAVLMFVLMKLFPPVLVPWADLAAEEIGEHATMTEMIVNFFTAEDFVGLLSRRAMLPLIVFSVLFGFSVQMTGGKDSIVGKWLSGLSDVMMKFVQIITYYAPVAFFSIFADLVATYGSEVVKGYGRALLVYYPLCFLYIFTAFPLFAWFGGGKGAVGIMFKHIARPAVVSLGCPGCTVSH